MLLQACSYLPSMDDVLPDKRTEYKKSETLPDLEVPPDLTAEAATEPMTIPTEEGASFSEYQHQRNAPAHPAATAAASVPGDQWVAIRGTPFDIWPGLRTYFQERSYSLELDDAELGVLETAWSQPWTKGPSTYRHKVKIFSEAGGDAGTTVLFISTQVQEQPPGTTDWIDRPRDEVMEKQFAGELNLYFASRTGAVASTPSAGTGPSAGGAFDAASAAQTPGKRAELMDAEDGKVILALPEEYSTAWVQTESAIQRGGFVLDAKDQTAGVYHITYFEAPPAEGEKKGWFSKLAFWKDDQPEGRPYQVSLTGVGDKTEVVVLNEDGEWENNPDANRILAIIQNQYNTR